MKFECESCHAQYMIADEKVGKRGVKVKCKRCSHVIIVRPDKGDAPAEAPSVTSAPPRVETAERSKVSPTEPPPNLEATSQKPAPLEVEKDPASSVPTPSEPEETGPARPAPISMAAETQLSGAPSDEGDNTQADPGGAFGLSADESEDQSALGGHSGHSAGDVDQGQDDAINTDAAAAPGHGGGDDEHSERAPIKGESSIGDALDDQLSGAFNSMFDEGRPGLEDLANMPGLHADGDDGEQRGPTKVLDLDAMNALRRQTAAQSSVVDRDALDSLRQDLGAPAGDETSGLWNEPRASADDARPGDDAPVWHVAIDDEDVGPITLGEMGRHIESGAVDQNSLVWKSGMDDWVPAAEIPAIQLIFDNLPPPKIGPSSDETGMRAGRPGLSSFDVGAPIDDLPSSGGGGSPFDNVPGMGMEESDPAWQPHGLTDVYQAANLAEAAGIGAGGGLIGDAGMAARGGGPSASASSEPEWRPSASSALASLVNEEIGRLENGPPAAPDDDLAPAPADDGALGLGGGLGGSLGGSLPFSSLTGADLDAGPEVSDPSLMAAPRSTGQMPLSSMPPSPGYDPNYPPGGMQMGGQMGFAPPPQPQRSPMMIFAGIGGGVMLLLLALLTYKVVFDKPQPVYVLGPNGLPVVPGQVAMVTPPTAVDPTAAGAPDPKAAAAAAATDPKADDAKADGAKADDAKADDAKADDAKADEAKADDAKADDAKADDAKAEEPETPKDDAKVASAKTPTRSTSTRKTTKAEPKPEPKEDPKPVKTSKSSKNCDPVLDFGCSASGGSSSSASASKSTLEKSDILPVVRDSLGKVKACGKRHNATGVIKMSWRIEKSGKTSNVTVADSKFAGTPVGGCVTDVVKGMRFPAYSGKAPPPVSIPLPLK